MDGALRVVALADSDSYLKWAAATLAALPAAWTRELLLIDTPAAPSASQRAAALAGTPFDADGMPVVAPVDLVAAVARSRPDVILVATRGPVALVTMRALEALDPRPVLVTGLPGISIPATRLALYFRQRADLFVLHSRREIREFEELARVRGEEHAFALATLPFAAQGIKAVASPSERARIDDRATDLVFAAQAIVPRSRDDRLAVCRILRDAALARPDRRVVLKVRALAGEQQTHREDDSLPDLLAELGPIPANLVVSAAPMAAALDTAEGLVTVSSTALIEAIVRRTPVIALDTFGVEERLINTVFAGSDLFAGADAVVARRFRHPDPRWVADNYLHDPADADVVDRIRALVAARRAGTLPLKQVAARPGGALRRAWDHRVAFGAPAPTPIGWAAVAIGTPARALVRALRRAS